MTVMIRNTIPPGDETIHLIQGNAYDLAVHVRIRWP